MTLSCLVKSTSPVKYALTQAIKKQLPFIFFYSKLLVFHHDKNYITGAGYKLVLEADISLIRMKQSLFWFSCPSLLKKLLIFKGRLGGLQCENERYEWGELIVMARRFIMDNCVLEGQRIFYRLEEMDIRLYLKAFLFKVLYFMTLWWNNTVVFSSTQVKNWGESVHIFIVFPDACKIFYLNKGTD